MTTLCKSATFCGGDEWISTAPIHKLLYDAFEWEMPTIGHPSVILSPSGRGKLSKRDQNFEENGVNVLIKTLDYRDEGYLSEAVVNWLANIGWTYGNDVEVFNIEDAIPRFTIPAMSPAPTKLPFSKLEWLNAQHIQAMDDEELVRLIIPFLSNSGIEVNIEALIALIPALKPRLKRPQDALEFLQFLDDELFELEASKLFHKKIGRNAAQDAFAQTYAFIAENEYDLDSLAKCLREIGEDATDNGKAGPFLGLMRYAVTGQKVSPPLFESMMALGQPRLLHRLDKAIALLPSDSQA